MSATDVAAAMVDGNKLDTASITYSDKTDSLGECTFAAGEYILILSVSNRTRSSIADIDLTRDAVSGGSRIISFTEIEPGTGELVMGHWNADQWRCVDSV